MSSESGTEKLRNKQEEKTVMRLWKKISAMAAMAAMCMTLAVPAAASAEEVNARIGGCGGNCDWTDNLERKEPGESREHWHITVIKDKNGKETILLDWCKITTIKVITYQACKTCGITKTNDSREEYEHEFVK